MDIELQDSTSMEQAEELLKAAQIIRIAFTRDDEPYIVPLSFGYEDGALYFHTGKKGRKLDMLRANPRVCFEVEQEVSVVKATSPCKFNMAYTSLVGFGKAGIVETDAAKRAGLDAIVRQYGAEPPVYDQSQLDRMVVVKISIERMRVRKVSP